VLAFGPRFAGIVLLADIRCGLHSNNYSSLLTVSGAFGSLRVLKRGETLSLDFWAGESEIVRSCLTLPAN
jgi:hypothetical protein